MMNVDDFEIEDKHWTIHDVFKEQRKHLLEYQDIEDNNDLLQTWDVPVEINDKQGQARLKDFAWRITEEITEATQAQRTHPTNPTHKQEELADAYHFLIELYILVGIGPDDLKLTYSDGGVFNTTEYHAYTVIQHIGNAMNCLKNKPWKTTHMLTDEKQFHKHLRGAHMAFLRLCGDMGMDTRQLFNMYFRKSEVNKFRQRSNY